jgi:CxxC motif-containing protein (DUF1111 family)
MAHVHRVWYLVVLLLAIAPAGIRSLSWRIPKGEAVDPEMAEAGQVLFNHEWYPGDPLAAGGDGLGPVFNAKSCVACHKQGGPGGGGDLQHNVTLFAISAPNSGQLVRSGVIHASAISPEFRENLSQADPAALAHDHASATAMTMRGGFGQAGLTPAHTHVSQRNTPALYGAKLIDDLPERVILAQERLEQLRSGLANSDDERQHVGRASRLPNGRLGRFGWKAQTATLSDFVQAACANELGLGNPGQAQPRPLGRPHYQPPGLDLTQEQCDQLTAFCASLPRPLERPSENAATREYERAGKKLFNSIGCADCHTANLGPIDGIYSDLLLHKMGKELVGGGAYNAPPREIPDMPTVEGAQPGEWRTPPLWGVGDSPPYLHDGRAATLDVAIQKHGGQAEDSADRFRKLNPTEQNELIAFLKTLRAP